jgi:SAM-dependent methyltransferase
VSGFSYDAIADLYDADMGASAPAGDVAFYASRAKEAPGPVLELGCGTGRIALALAAQGAQVLGLDRSLPMLRELNRKRASLPAEAQARVRAVCMDARACSLRGRFALVLCPYSAITCLVDARDRRAVLRWARTLLGEAGRFALDVFVPSRTIAILPDEHVFHDYRRPLPGGGMLRRSKVICKDPARRVNTIERRYSVEDASGSPLREVITRESIRWFEPDELCAELEGAGLRVVERVPDFGVGNGESASTVALVCAPQRDSARGSG